MAEIEPTSVLVENPVPVTTEAGYLAAPPPGVEPVSIEAPAAAGDAQIMKTEFVYADGAVNDVKLVGDWNNWLPVDMFYEGDGLWSVLTPVPVGKHEYRFLADGEWKVSSRHPLVGDEADDTLNNYREVALPVPQPPPKPKVKGRDPSTVKRKKCSIM